MTEGKPLIDWEMYEAARHELGGAFLRILGYFREDGDASVATIEQAMRDKDPVAIVNPAHKLKAEALQFGATRLASLAEDIEVFARHCVEAHQSPDEYIDRVVGLRPLLSESLAELERDANPLVQRKPQGFGNSSPLRSVNGGFGNNDW